METKEIVSWQAWKDEIARLQEEGLSLRKAEDHSYFSTMLFRGQNCASWELKSTLERRSCTLPSVNEYAKTVKSAKAAFESLTDQTWETSFKNEEFPAPPEDYEFLVCLRHHGFPTPILDWTRSPYAAAFFAFQMKSPERAVAIFAYREFDGGPKVGSPGESTIVACGPTIRTDKRHYWQQAEYTFCRRRTGDEWYYSGHEEAFARSDGDQDVLVKYTLPASLRKEALADLDAMNINAYSLFGSEEGLSEMLANRQYGYDS